MQVLWWRTHAPNPSGKIDDPLGVVHRERKCLLPEHRVVIYKVHNREQDCVQLDPDHGPPQCICVHLYQHCPRGDVAIAAGEATELQKAGTTLGREEHDGQVKEGGPRHRSP